MSQRRHRKGPIARPTLDLSITAGNGELAAFYLHEVEELLGQIEILFPNHAGL